MIDPKIVHPDASLSQHPDPASFRSLFLSRMRGVPGSVAIIATIDAGERRGLAATAWCSLSADPPTMLICVNHNASAHDFIVRSGLFSVNQLADSHEEIVAIFSNQRGLTGDGRFVDQDWRPGVKTTPLFTHALTSYECVVIEHLSYSTHSIFIGQVIQIQSSGAVLSPAVYLDGSVCTATPFEISPTRAP